MHFKLNTLATKRPFTLATFEKPVLVFTLWFLPKDLVVRVQVRVGGWNLRFHPLLYYLTSNLFLKLLVSRRLVQNLTEPVSTPLEHTLPYPLEHREGASEPCAVTVNTDDNKLGFRILILRRAILYEIALLQVRNLKLELNLRPIMFRNVRFNLPTHRTLNFDQNSIFSNTVGRGTKPRVVPVLDQTNLMGLSVIFLVIKVPNQGLEQGAVRRRCVSGPLGP